jgi:hypothetical protein
MGHDRQSPQRLGQLPGQNKAGRTAVEENGLMRLNLAERGAGNLLFLGPMD